MNISNINTENGAIYFHANSVPYLLENNANFSVIQKISKEIDGEIISNEADGFIEITENYYYHLIEHYILELKTDWQEIETSDTDNYLSEIDEEYFNSDFCEVYFNSKDRPDNYADVDFFYFSFKVKKSFININLVNIEIESITEKSDKGIATSLNYKTANEVFQKMYNESESYLLVIAKEILIRSHQDYLYSKKQIVVV